MLKAEPLPSGFFENNLHEINLYEIKLPPK